MAIQYYNYIALAVFVLLSISVPASFLLTSKFLRPSPSKNKTKQAPYESAEATIGKTRDVDNEYISFFALFLPFEIISMVLVLWALVARSLDPLTNALALGLAVLSMFLALIGYKFTNLG